MDVSDVNHHVDQLDLTSKVHNCDFCGIYTYGYDRPFIFEEHRIPLKSFRVFSEYEYPIFLFYNHKQPGELPKLMESFSNVILLPIEPMYSIHDYDKFMMWECFNRISIENTLTIHQDGFLLNPGWESMAINFDYIGASWRAHIGDFESHYKNNDFAKFEGYENIHTTTSVGNGGFCFRKKSKMIEVQKSVNYEKYIESGECNKNLPDDIFFSFYGFGKGIFKPVTDYEADLWSQEPLNDGNSFGFHNFRK
jgi:hypothetical protein